MRRMSRGGWIPAIACVLLLAGCGGGGGGGDSDDVAGDLVLVDVNVAGLVGVSLNEIILIEFSEVLDPDTVRPDTIRIRQGPNYGKQVPGDFRVDGNVVHFYPRLPLESDLSDAGLQPGTPYRVILPGHPETATVRNYQGEKLVRSATADFQTALTDSPNLFKDNFLDPLPPRILAVNPPEGATEVPADSRLLLTFNKRPLLPSTVSVSNVRLWMIERLGEQITRPMPIEPVLLQSHESVQVEIRPIFPLADQATYRIEVDRRVQDLVGNDLQPGAGQASYVSTFRVRDEEFRTSQLDLTFNQEERDEVMDQVVTTASWNESVADAVAALFTIAGGNGTAGDLTPISNQTVHPLQFTRGVETKVLDGVEVDVYNFRAIEIPEGVTVRFIQRPGGPNRPILLLSLKNVVINGTITVSGGAGQNGENSAYTTSFVPLAAGGAAGPGGGDGSDNYTGGSGEFTPAPEMDGDSVTMGGGGGDGGGHGTYTYSYYGSSTYYYKYSYSYQGGAGGGGGNRTRGQDGEKGSYPSYAGAGGKGGRSVTDRGFPLNLERRPNVGGGGAGAGGAGYYDYYYYTSSSTSRTQYYGGAGSGGGGGGGITVQSAGDVTIGSNGAILADGGRGGNSMTYYVYAGGSGGGGAGGSIKVVATGQVHLQPGATLSVEGGVGGIFTGTYTYYPLGKGGEGGDGYLRFEAIEDENSPGKPLVNGVAQAKLSYGPPSLGTFAPEGGGAPSIAQTKWMNLGVFDPVMLKPEASDVVATLFNDTMKIEIQMAVEDLQNLGSPDLGDLDFADQDGDGQRDDTLDTATLSEWVELSQIETLNGNHYQFIRVRVTFQLDDTQRASHPLPYLDFLRIPFGF